MFILGYWCLLQGDVYIMNRQTAAPNVHATQFIDYLPSSLCNTKWRHSRSFRYTVITSNVVTDFRCRHWRFNIDKVDIT